MKRHLLVEGRGVPLAVTVSGANAVDARGAAPTLEAVVVARPDPSELPQHLYVDGAYAKEPCRSELEAQGYRVHVPRKGLGTPGAEEHAAEAPAAGESPAEVRHPARRWVVERAHAWLHRFRKLLVRYERYESNYLGLVQFACALIVARKLLG